jgi:hypothetical protein
VVLHDLHPLNQMVDFFFRIVKLSNPFHCGHLVIDGPLKSDLNVVTTDMPDRPSTFNPI